MDEYTIDVVIDGKQDTLKTFCNTIYSAIDSMIGLDVVEEIISVTRLKDNKTWDVKDMDVKYLRNLRNQMDETLLNEGIQNVEEKYNEVQH
jgi:hypothetical protein